MTEPPVGAGGSQAPQKGAIGISLDILFPWRKLRQARLRSIHRLADYFGVVLGYTGSPCFVPGMYTTFPDQEHEVQVSRGGRFPCNPETKDEAYWALIHSRRKPAA